MTADSVDLEACYDTYQGIVGSMFDDMNLTMLDTDNLNDPKLQPVQCPLDSFSDMKYQKYSYDDIYPDLFRYEDCLLPHFDDPIAGSFVDCKTKSSLDQNSCPLDDKETEYLCSTLVSPNLILPDSSSPDAPNSILPLHVNEDSLDEAIDSNWPEGSDINDFKLLKFVDGGYLGDELVSVDDLFKKNKRRKLTHLDFDHCYSQPPEQEEDDSDDHYDDEYDFFYSHMNSPAFSCTGKTKGVKRALPKRKAAKQIKIKQEIITSDEEDVETPCPVPLVVPKITISLAPPPVKTGPAKRGRKPKNKTEGQNVKKSNKNCPVSAKALQAAIKQQKQRCYITKSGRVSNKISNSVETTPSTSTQSSLSNSRCTSDNEDTVDKRASHNMAERNRRQELTNLFQNLRRKTPAIEKILKASKVLILTSAANYIKSLESIDEEKTSQQQQLRAEIEKKLAKVQSLRNSLGYSS